MAERESGSEERIGAYQILGLLGRGGMGEVFLAWDDRLKRRVAIKRLRRDSDLHPSLRRRLLREARAVASLSHPAIVQVYDLLEDAAGDCLVLEYAEGKTLAATLAAGPLEPALAIRLVREIADGLAAAHAARIVHRDLKPENVIVTPSSHAKVLDFGLARMQATGEVILTQHGALLGTYHTMSPEQANGGEADERSDLFSLGVVLYEMLTGRSPFRGAYPLETLQRVTTQHPPRADTVRPGVPTRLGVLTERLLAKDPNNRPAGAADVVRELEAIEASLSAINLPVTESVSDQPTKIMPIVPYGPQDAISRSPTAPSSSAGLSALSRLRSWKVAAFALLAAAAVGAGLLWMSRPAKEPVRSEPLQPLRIVVPRPEVAGEDERLEMAASGVLTASLDALGSLEGVAALDPLQLVGSPKSAFEMARAAAADEVLAIRLETSGSLGRVTMRRIHGADGKVLWTDAFDAPLDRDLRLLANTVGIHLRRGYPRRRPRPGTIAPDVRDEDYAAFLEIKQRSDAGRIPTPFDLARLERIVKGSPRFLEAQLLASEVSLWLYRSSKEGAYRDQSMEFVQSARALAPNDPRPLQQRFRIEMAGDQPRAAAATLAQIEGLLPGDPQILVFRARISEHEGRMEEALAALRIAAERVPSWQNLNALADLEARMGHIAEARRNLKLILESSPDNIWALDTLAAIELFFGDLQEAGRIYEALTIKDPQRSFFNNLGVVRALQGRHEDTVKLLHRALAIDPDHSTPFSTWLRPSSTLDAGRRRKRSSGKSCGRSRETGLQAVSRPKTV